MGTVVPLTVAMMGAAVAGAGLFRWVFAKASRGAPANPGDMRAIEAALAPEGGQVVRACRDRPGNLVGRSEYLDEQTGARLYRVTIQIGSVTVKRRVAVRDGHPATILP